MRILVVDDHEVVREGLVATLREGEGDHTVTTAPTAADALRQLALDEPDVAVVDLRLPDMSGADLCRRITTEYPSIACVMLTSYLSETTVREAQASGACAYVTKAAGLPELRRVLREIETGGLGTTPENGPQIVQRLHEIVTERSSTALLTPQQERVLELAASGLTNHEIGTRLFISESTVRFHVQKLKARFDARSRTNLIARAIRSGAIAPAPDDAVTGA